MEKGKFIVLEGLDGSGKGTQLRLLEDYIKSKGKNVYSTAEPTFSTVGGAIRDSLGGFTERNAYELSALFLADRITHNVNPVNGIKKYIGNGIDVICDRYYYSSFAYQGIDADLEWVMKINLECREILKPDLCVFLDIDESVCDERIKENRFSREVYENIETQKRVRKGFFEVFRILEENENIYIVNADRDAETVSADICALYDRIHI